MKYTKSYVESVSEKHELDFVYDPKVTVLGQEPIDIDGRVVNKSVYVTKDLADEKKNVKVEDFFLENLIANGAIVGLAPVSLDGSMLGTTDNIVSQLESIEVGE